MPEVTAEAVPPTEGSAGFPQIISEPIAFSAETTISWRITGEMRQTRMYGHQLILRRSIETSLFSDSIKIRDEIMNPQCTDETYMLLYHCNFGYPLLSEDTEVTVHGGKITPLGENSRDPRHMCEPSPDAKEVAVPLRKRRFRNGV